MRYIYCEPLGQNVSALGFGCASLGSRVSAELGLRRLDEAFDSGVTWFDVAPAYGDGTAEEILGTFLRSRRDKVVVCTKVGLSPAHRGPLLEWVKPAARGIINAVPALRSVSRRSRRPNAKLSITPELIRRSVAESLTRLGTDYLDVIALHDADPAECAQEAVIAVLAGMVERGLVRAVSIASSAQSVIAGSAAWKGYGIAQVRGSAVTADLDQLDACLTRPMFRVVHGAFGVDGTLAVLEARLHDATNRKRLSTLGYVGSIKEISAAALIDEALYRNRHGVVLCSMFNPEHLLINCSRANRDLNSEAATSIREILDLA